MQENHLHLVLTSEEAIASETGIKCAMCQKILAVWNDSADEQDPAHVPSPEHLFQAGAVPVPNFGWFCSQDCATTYSETYGVTFQRDTHGNVAYY